MLNVLVACEESQAVCKAFRELGHNAFSCDIQECSGGHPEWHIRGDVLKVIDRTPVFPNEKPHIEFFTMDNEHHCFENWDLLIAHPPCTYLSNVATRAFSLRVTPADKVVDRWQNRAKAAVFFMRLALADAPKIAVGNPIGFMSSAYRKADQIIQPYMWAESTDDKENYHSKKTCLWLKGLPPLKGNGKFNSFSCSIYGKYSNGKNRTWEDSFSRSAKVRSKTFPGIAKAMAEQWSAYIESAKED